MRKRVGPSDFLARLRDELPQVEAVFLVDPQGIIAASSRAYPMPRYDVHLAEYFSAALAQNNDTLVITAPFPGTRSGTTGFILSRRRARDGNFDGVVAVTVSPQYFKTFYRMILDDPRASAAEHHSRTPHRFHSEQPGGGPYESTSQGHQWYPNPDRQPYVTQFDRPAS